MAINFEERAYDVVGKPFGRCTLLRLSVPETFQIRSFSSMQRDEQGLSVGNIASANGYR